MRRVAVLVLVVALAVSFGRAQAEDKPNPVGTWKWSVSFGGQSRELTLKLKMKEDKLTGAMVRNDQETPIEDVKFKDGKLSFKITRERDGQKFVIKYEGKLKGDTIKGKTEFNRQGQTQSRDWEAKREKKDTKSETADK